MKNRQHVDVVYMAAEVKTTLPPQAHPTAHLKMRDGGERVAVPDAAHPSSSSSLKMNLYRAAGSCVLATLTATTRSGSARIQIRQILWKLNRSCRQLRQPTLTSVCVLCHSPSPCLSPSLPAPLHPLPLSRDLMSPVS